MEDWRSIVLPAGSILTRVSHRSRVSSVNSVPLQVSSSLYQVDPSSSVQVLSTL